ncbi:MAG: PAS domain S-box protein [Ignavibacteriaceae bacterium]
MNSSEDLILTEQVEPANHFRLYKEAFIRTDYRGNIIDYAVTSSNDLCSSEPPSFLYKKIDDVFPPPLVNKMYETLFKVIHKNVVINVSFSISSGNSRKIYKARFIPSVNEQIIMVIREVTKSRITQKALLNSKKRLNAVWKNSTDGMRLIDKKGTIVAVNDSYCRLVELNEKELINQPFQVVYNNLSKDELDKYITRFGTQFREKKIRASFETKIILHNGNIKYVEVVNAFVNANESEHLSDDEILLLSIFRDITAQKEAQQTEKLLADIVDSSHDAIIGNSLNGIIASWNTGAEKIFGYSKDEVRGLSVSFLFPPERADEISGILERIGNGDKIDNYETVCVTKAGIPIYISATFSPIKDSSRFINGVSIIARDITDKKVIEQNLRESEERYRSLIETSPDAILLTDFEGKIIMGNRLVAGMLSVNSIEDIVGNSIFNHILKEERFRVFRDAKNLLETGRFKNKEFNLLDKDGQLLPVEVSSSLIVNNMGMPYAVISVVRDVSERKAAQEALRNSELQFRSIWENSNDGMRLTDEDGYTIAVNRAFSELVQIDENNLIGKPFNIVYKNSENFFFEESLNLYRKNFRERNFKTHKQSKSTFNCNKTVELDVTYSMLEFERGKPLLLAIFHDITERKKAEEELRKNEKHAAIGKMAAYLSHEIKTPLASIKMNIDMLSRSLEIPKEKQKSFSIIQKEIKRLNNLLKNVLQFSRQVDLVYVNINFFNLVNNIKDFLEPSLIEKRIVFINNIKQVNIKGDYQKLHSALLHMIENSLEAITGSGAIEISSSVNRQNNKVSIFIKDTGCGIALTTHIFDPFFTTKSAGTGLGLSIAQKIIEQHNGKICLVSSKPGETIFEISFLNQ